MRELRIVTDYVVEADGRRIAIQSPGFINPLRIDRLELIRLAGWSDDTDSLLADYVIVCPTVHQLCDAGDYEHSDEVRLGGDYQSLGEQLLIPNDGEYWIYVLGKRVYLN